MKKILLLEDDPLLKLVYSEELQSCFDVTTCSRFHDAISQMKQTPFDIILIDYELEDGNLNDFNEHIFNSKNITYILLSNHSPSFFAHFTWKSYCSQFLIKLETSPQDLRTLLQKL